MSKVYERILFKQIGTFKDFFFSSQFQCGFGKGYSTQQCLLALIEKWKSALNKDWFVEGPWFSSTRTTNSKITFIWFESKLINLLTAINPQLFI